jgi:hypothetical protein
MLHCLPVSQRRLKWPNILRAAASAVQLIHLTATIAQNLTRQ